MQREGIIMEEVVIVGGGIAGLATAVALKRVGVRSLVLERSEALRASGAALALFPNAWLALDALGVSHKLSSLYSNPVRGAVTNVGTGTTQDLHFQAPKGANAQGPRVVHRKALLEALAQELPINSIRFSSKLVAMETEQLQGNTPVAVLHLDDGTVIRSKVLIGCDGVHSAVAQWLGLKEPVHSGRSAVRGLAVFPEGHGFKHFQQFLDGCKRAGIAPINDKEVYWFLVCPSPPNGQNVTKDPEQIQRDVIEKHAVNLPSVFLDVVRHADLSSLSWAPLLFRYPWDVIFGNLSRGNVTVAGDAMHPMTPDLGQGGCSALEDAVVLGRHIGNSIIKNGKLVHGDIARALDEYAKERRWRGATLITASYISGRVQQGGEKWWMKYLRDSIFYRYIFARMISVMHHDCGKLPDVSKGKSDHSSRNE